MSREPDPWADLNRACAVLHLAASNGVASEGHWQRCDAARAAVEKLTLDDGMTLALTERHLRDCYDIAKVLDLKVPETRNMLFAAVRLFAMARAQRKEARGDRVLSQPRFYWQDKDE